MSEGTLIQMSAVQYQAFLDTSKVLPDTDPRAQMVSRVGNKVKEATESFLTKKGFSKDWMDLTGNLKQ